MPANTTPNIPDIADIHLARARINDWTRLTPVINDSGLDQELGCVLYCKCENLQRTGAFKFRGASNAISRLRENEIDGDVATHSSGNHGASLALAARLDHREAHVVMPDNSVSMKIDAVRRFGGIVHFCAPTDKSREEELEKLVKGGFIPVHPYDNADIIAGQGTAALEFIQKIPTLEQVVTPVGGGGLISGTAIAVRGTGQQVYGVEPEGAADTVASLKQGERVTSWTPDTIADGLRAIVGVRNFSVIRSDVTQVFTVSDEDIRRAMYLFWQQLRLVIEPSSATVIAAIRNHPEVFAGKKVGAIISGGNIRPGTWHSLTHRDRPPPTG
jgi:threonine dehydratase